MRRRECEGPIEPDIRRYPYRGNIQASVNGMLLLANTNNPNPSEVETREVVPHRHHSPHTDNANPRTSLEAKFDIPHRIVHALTVRKMKVIRFKNGAEVDPIVGGLLPRTKALAHPEISADDRYEWAAEVVVRTKGGHRLALRIYDYERCGPGAQ